MCTFQEDVVVEAFQVQVNHRSALGNGRVVDGTDHVRSVRSVNADASLKQFGGDLQFELGSIRRRVRHHSNVRAMPERLVVFIPVVSVAPRYKVCAFCVVRNVVADHFPLAIVLLLVVVDVLDDTPPYHRGLCSFLFGAQRRILDIGTCADECPERRCVKYVSEERYRT